MAISSNSWSLTTTNVSPLLPFPFKLFPAFPPFPLPPVPPFPLPSPALIDLDCLLPLLPLLDFLPFAFFDFAFLEEEEKNDGVTDGAFENVGIDVGDELGS